jgi:streptogramin lyase
MSIEVPDLIGSDFLGYRIEELIGRGGMGVVYRAYDLRLKRTVALKLMAPDVARDQGFRERFLRETELAASLEHPNVVPIHDAGNVDGRLYLAMRHVEGGDLRAVLRSGEAPTPARTLELVRQVASALDAAHASGLVHRDVKPSNVLLDGRGHVYLADFGLTRRLDDLGPEAADGRSLGTPAYLAPEQIEGGTVDGRTDVYALGCLLYECLTGSPPFARDSRLAVAWAHLEEEPPSASAARPDLPEAIDAVIAKAMAKDPAQRYPTCAELVAAAEAALGLGRLKVSGRRHLALLALTLLLGVAALATALGLRSGGGAAGAPLAAKGNSVVRVDPATGAIEAVVELDREPAAVAVGGDSVWVHVHGAILELDPRNNEIRHTTRISTLPLSLSTGTGPVLAADAGGAWLVGFGSDDGAFRDRLTRVLAGGRGKQDYPIDGRPVAVAVGEGAVWVLARRQMDSAVLRIDAATGAVLGTTLVRSSRGAGSDRGQQPVADGLAVGDGGVFVMESGTATLHRVDVGTGRVTASRDLGDFASPPAVAYDSVWVCAADPGSSILRLKPSTLDTLVQLHSIPAENGRFAIGHGALWRHDVPSGNVVRFDPADGRMVGTIRVTPTPPEPAARLGLEPTAIAAGAGAIWVTVSD